MSDWQLVPLPWDSWSDVREAVSGHLAEGYATWLWADNDGVQCVDRLPDEAPFTTHVWGWGSELWFRLRVDAERAAGACLVRGTTVAVAPASKGSGPGFFTVTEFRSAGRNRVAERSMLPQLDHWLRQVPITVFQVRGAHPMTFLEIPDAGKRAMAAALDASGRAAK